MRSKVDLQHANQVHTFDVKYCEESIEQAVGARDNKSDEPKLFGAVQQEPDAGRSYKSGDQHPKAHLTNLLVQLV